MGGCVFLGMMAWYFGKPPNVRLYETKSEGQLTVAIAPYVDMTLDAQSGVAIKEGNPLQAELFRGEVYFDIKKDAKNALEVKVGNAMIRDFGTRFSIKKYDNGSNHIAVADGYIKIHVTSGVFQINAFEQADFDDKSISQHRLVIERDIAPWRQLPK